MKPRRAPAPVAAPPLAVIDIGSSAIRMALAEPGPHGMRFLEQLQRAVPLGRDAFTRGRLETPTINHAIEVLRGYQEILQTYQVHAVRTVATSAVGAASNRELFVERVYLATGLAVDVITGAEEQRLLYAALRDALGERGMARLENALLVEEGAGSLEIAKLAGGEVSATSSYPLGTMRLRALLGSERRGAIEVADLMKRFIGSPMDEVAHAFALADTRQLVFIGGDVRFAADQLLPRGGDRGLRRIGRDRFLRFARTMARLTPEEIARRTRRPFEDCESLPPAMVTYGELCKRSAAREVLVPEISLRDGLLLDLRAEIAGERPAEISAQIYASAESLGRRYEYDEEHARRVADYAGALFDALQSEHRLDRRARRLLRVAALLHDIGVFVSSNSHHKHSEYLINASDIFGLRTEEKAIVACVARYHRRSTPQVTHAGYGSLSRQDRATVAKLAALLRVADALDRSHSGRVELVAVALQPDELRLGLRSNEDLALERLAMRTKGTLFEEVFGRKVVLLHENASAEEVPA